MTSSIERARRRTRRTLALLVLFGLAIRVAYLLHVTSQPGFVWDDPDSYMRHGERLASGEGGWRFDFEAVEHRVEGGRYVLPPLYPVFLSLFALFPGYPLTAQGAQAILAALGIVLVFLMGREIHSETAGLLGAALWAVWLPNVIAVWSTMQEALYVPVALLGLVLLVRAVAFRGHVLGGLLLGLAALTRSIPVYYLPIAIALILWREGLKRGLPLASGLALGFALLTVPYSVALSRHLGVPTFIENHGGLRIAAEGGVAPGDRPPGVAETAATLIRGLVAAPARTVAGWGDTARSILHVNGGRLLQIYLASETKLGSRLWKSAAVLSDVLLVAVLVLAPFGLLLCRRPDRGGLLGAWVLLNFALTVLSGFGGPRLRAPIEPVLVAFAAVTLSRGFRRPRRFTIAGAAALSLLLAAVAAPQLRRSVAARGDYGVHWPLDPPPKRSAMSGSSGFNVLSSAGFVELAVRPRNEGAPTAVRVFLEGGLVEEVLVDELEHWFRYEWPSLALVYVELEARDAAAGEPVRALVIVPGPR